MTSREAPVPRSSTLSLDECAQQLNNQPLCYLLRCVNPDRRLTYTGSTNNVRRRWRQHNYELKSGGARITTGQSKHGFLWTPILVVVCPTLRCAKSLEKHVKILKLKTVPGDWKSDGWRTSDDKKIHARVRKVLAACNLPKFVHPPDATTLVGEPSLRLVWFDSSYEPVAHLPCPSASVAPGAYVAGHVATVRLTTLEKGMLATSSRPFTERCLQLQRQEQIQKRCKSHSIQRALLLSTGPVVTSTTKDEQNPSDSDRVGPGSLPLANPPSDTSEQDPPRKATRKRKATWVILPNCPRAHAKQLPRNSMS